MLKHLLFVLLVFSCAGNTWAQEPQWLKDARAREGKDLKEQPVRSKDGVFTGTVVGRVLSKEIVVDSETYTIEIDIGSEAPMVCEVIVDGFDLAGMLQATADLTFKEIASRLGKVEQRAIERTDAGAYGSSAYIALDWVFRVSSGKEARVGGLKQVVASNGDHGLYCAHDDLGYAKSFQTAVRSLAESLKLTNQKTTPYFVEISTASVQREKVGVSMLRMERDQDGDTKVTESTALAIRVTADTLQAQDTIHVQWIRPDGSMISASHIGSSNGEIDMALELTQTTDGKWLVEGEFKGKDIERVIESKAQPATMLQEARTTRGLFGRADVVGTQRKTAKWTTADPTRLIETEMTILSIVDPEHLAARETLEGISADLVLEKSTGIPSRALVQLGPVSIEIDRVYKQGSF